MNHFIHRSFLTVLPIIVAGCGGRAAPDDTLPVADDGAGTARVQTAASELDWKPFFPGSPVNEAVAWGDPKDGPLGFMLQLPAGFDSGWHTHHADYQGVVIEGTIYEVEQGAATAKPLPEGSYYLEPGRANHATRCDKREPCVIYIHQNAGLSFDPVNADGSPVDPTKANVIAQVSTTPRAQVAASELGWNPFFPGSPVHEAVAWGDPKTGPLGFMLRLPAGFDSGWHTHDVDYQAVVLAGTIEEVDRGETASKPLAKGSYYLEPGARTHSTRCAAGADCILYIHQAGGLSFHPTTADGTPVPTK